MSKNKGFKKFVLGAAVGAGLGVLFAPKKGSETRKILKLKMDELVSKIKDLDSEEIKQTIENKLEEIKEGLEDLDKEKVAKIAKRKAKQLQNSAEELVDYVVEKGTPILEKSANVIREKTILVTKEVLKKLEQEEK